MGKKYSVIVTVAAVLILLAFTVLFFHGDYDTKLLIKLGLKERVAQPNWAVISWESCLEQLNYDADIVFFGNSITKGGNFQDYFKDKKIVNLGYWGDTLSGMTERVKMIKNLTPEKIFLMGGINNLNDNNIDSCVEQYETLLKTIQDEVPDAEIYVQSVLPVSKTREKTKCSNNTIKKFNKEIEKLTKKYNLTYIELFSLFIVDNDLETVLSEDGLHINKKGYDVWAQAISEYIE